MVRWCGDSVSLVPVTGAVAECGAAATTSRLTADAVGTRAITAAMQVNSTTSARRAQAGMRHSSHRLPGQLSGSGGRRPAALRLHPEAGTVAGRRTLGPRLLSPRFGRSVPGPWTGLGGAAAGVVGPRHGIGHIGSVSTVVPGCGRPRLR